MPQKDLKQEALEILEATVAVQKRHEKLQALKQAMISKERLAGSIHRPMQSSVQPRETSIYTAYFEAEEAFRAILNKAALTDRFVMVIEKEINSHNSNKPCLYNN